MSSLNPPANYRVISLTNDPPPPDMPEQASSARHDGQGSPPVESAFSLFETSRPLGSPDETDEILELSSEDETINRKAEKPAERCELTLSGEKSYFETELPREATFDIAMSDWEKLKSFQRGHRFQPGQWEDYFVVGMKQSNKYCVFAFKDHYVNKTCIRNRRISLNKDQTPGKKSELKKVFSAHGYCVFEDCSVKFLIKMDDQLVVHVAYEGRLKHSVNEVNARYFRGPSRQELKDVLKRTTPMREYLQRVQTMVNTGRLEGGNADFVGKSTSVYRRISSEARECYQALLMLRMRLIEKSYLTLEQKLVKIAGIGCWHRPFVKGFIQMIQHIPGSIVCYSDQQIHVLNSILRKSRATQMMKRGPSCLHVSCCLDSSPVSTTIDGKALYFMEISAKNPLKETNYVDENQLIPLSCCILTNPFSKTTLNQWFSMLLDSEASIFPQTVAERSDLYIVCDNSMPLVDAILLGLNKETFEEYSIRLFREVSTFSDNGPFEVDLAKLNASVKEICGIRIARTERQTPRTIIHICSNQFMDEIGVLCKTHYQSESNFTFAMYAFSIILNSQTLDELQKTLYAFMCILYSETINKKVKKAFDYMKSVLVGLESPKNKPALEKFYFYKNQIPSSNETIASKALKTVNSHHETDGIHESNHGLTCLSHRSSFKNTTPTSIERRRLDALNCRSPFFHMCLKLYEQVKADMDEQERQEALEQHLAERNPRLGRTLLYYFIVQFAATLPLWTKLQAPDESELTSEYPVTLKGQRERFQKLALPEEEEKEPLDVFIKRLFDESIQNLEPISNALIRSEVSDNDINLSQETICSSGSLIDLLSNEEREDAAYASSTEEEKETGIDTFRSSKERSRKSDIIRFSLKKSLDSDSKSERKAKRARPSAEKVSGDGQDTSRGSSNSNETFNDERSRMEEDFEKEIIIEREPQIKVISNAFDIELTKDDLDSLDSPQKFPTPNVIEFYLKILEQKANSSEVSVQSRVQVFANSFYKELKANGGKCLNKSNIFESNLIIIPIQKTNHWGLAAIDFIKQKITYYDPMLLNDYECLKNLTDFLANEYKSLAQTNYELKNWKISNEKNIPKQSSFKDCGLYILFYAKRLINSQDLVSATKAEIESFRSQLKKEIFEQILI